MAAKIKIEFPNGEQKSYPIGTVPQQILQEIGGRIAKEALIARFNDQFIDLSRPLSVDGKLVFLTFADEDGRDAFWHSSAHILAHAIKALYPEAKFAFGPPVENGFYYDFELTTPLTVGDLEKIEAKMQEIVSADLSFVRQEMTTEKALALFRARNESYKVEQIERLGEPPSIYTDGDFVDLCRGPHLASTGLVRHFKLLSIAGAYWLGDEKNAMLQRVYGISFPKKSQLDDYLIRLEEAKKRDHRKLGRELDLFSINDEIGPGLVLWHPKGAFIRHKIEEFWKEQHLKGGYQFVNTPHVAKLDLWKTSGHVDFFKENMFSPMKVEEMQYQIKPMNCPFHLHIYKSAMRSYRDLPIRWAELGTVYRYERSGVMHGLMRVRGFTQDDAHIFCRPDQLDAETERTVKFSMSMLDSFGFSGYDVYVSTRPQNAVGSVENWETATQALKNSLERLSIPYQVDPGEGVFYGPKIDIKIRDAIGRSWQCSTIQVDFNEPERFDLSFIGQDGERHRPIMIHRALLGSLERFFGVLIEHYSGAFPLWLAPVQVCVIPITEKEQSYAAEVFHQLEEAGIRAELDDRNEKVGYKIREASTQKIPIMLVIGPREVQEQTVAIRKRGVGDVGSGSLAEVIKEIELQVAEKKN